MTGLLSASLYLSNNYGIFLWCLTLIWNLIRGFFFSFDDMSQGKNEVNIFIERKKKERKERVIDPWMSVRENERGRKVVSYQNCRVLSLVSQKMNVSTVCVCVLKRNNREKALAPQKEVDRDKRWTIRLLDIRNKNTFLWMNFSMLVSFFIVFFLGSLSLSVGCVPFCLYLAVYVCCIFWLLLSASLCFFRRIWSHHPAWFDLNVICS